MAWEDIPLNKTGVLMLKDCGSRKVTLSQIETVHHLSLQTKSLLFSREPSLQDIQSMTDLAVKSYIIQHPPVVYEDKNKKCGFHLLCIANLFSLYIAQKRLSGSEKVRVILVEAPLRKDMEALAISLALSSEACHVLYPKNSSKYLVSLWQYLSRYHPQALLNISEKLGTKASFCEAFSLNRRDFKKSESYGK